MEPVIDQIVAALGALLAVVTTAFLTWLAAWLRARFMVQQDKDRADSLNTAVTNAAGGVINVLGDKSADVVTVAMPAVKEAVAYVKKMNPGDVEYFKLEPPQIAEKVVNAVGKLKAQSK